MDGSRLETYEMINTSFLIDLKDEKSHFYKKTFQLAHNSIDLAFIIFILTLSNVKVNFNNQKL